MPENTRTSLPISSGRDSTDSSDFGLNLRSSIAVAAAVSRSIGATWRLAVRKMRAMPAPSTARAMSAAMPI
jgi:hypothetical protein